MNCTYHKLNVATGSYPLGMFISCSVHLILNICHNFYDWFDVFTFGTAIIAKLLLWIFIEAVRDVHIIYA